MCKTVEHWWTEGRLRLYLLMRHHGGDIKWDEAITPRKICKTSSALLHRKKRSLTPRKCWSTINYAGAVELNHGVQLIDGPIKYILDDTLLFEYLPSTVQVSYVQYMHLSKLCMNESDLLSLLGRLSPDCRTGSNLGIFHLDCSILYSAEPDKSGADGRLRELPHQQTNQGQLVWSILCLFCLYYGCKAAQGVHSVCHCVMFFFSVHYVSTSAGPVPFLPSCELVVSR